MDKRPEKEVDDDLPSQPIRVIFVDDHTMVRRGLATFVKVYDDLQLVGETENGTDAIQLYAEILPDVVLIEMVMPGMDGVSVTRVIRQQFRSVVVLALRVQEGKLVKNALEAE